MAKTKAEMAEEAKAAAQKRVDQTGKHLAEISKARGAMEAMLDAAVKAAHDSHEHAKQVLAGLE